MKLRLLNKKSQIGTTLTWFFGFLIIFFILLIFLSISLGLAGKKEAVNSVTSIFSVSGGLNFYVSNNIWTSQNFFAFLNSQAEESGERFSNIDLIFSVFENDKKEDETLLKANFKDFIDKNKFPCDSFYIKGKNKTTYVTAAPSTAPDMGTMGSRPLDLGGEKRIYIYSFKKGLVELNLRGEKCK